MKVLVIAVHPLQDNRISKMIHTIARNGDKVIYINISVNQNVDDAVFKGIKVIKIHEDFRKNNPRGVFSAFLAVKKMIKRIRPNVVHIHDPYLIPLLKAARSVGAITVYDKHEAYEVMNSFPAKVGTFLERRYIQYIDGVVYVADSQRAYIDRLGYKHIAKVPNFQSLERFSKAKKLHHNGCRLIYVGSLSSESRNIMEMLDIIESILSKNNNTSCIIGGTSEEASVNQRLEELSARFNNFVYKGYLLYDDVIQETVNSDIGLYLTKYDPNNVGSSPNKINEYLMAGIAIVAQGRFQDWDKIHKKAGFVFDYDCNSSEIAEAIQTLIDDQETLKAFEKTSQILGSERTYEAVENRYRDLYNEILLSKKND